MGLPIWLGLPGLIGQIDPSLLHNRVAVVVILLLWFLMGAYIGSVPVFMTKSKPKLLYVCFIYCLALIALIMLISSLSSSAKPQYTSHAIIAMALGLGVAMVPIPAGDKLTFRRLVPGWQVSTWGLLHGIVIVSIIGDILLAIYVLPLIPGMSGLGRTSPAFTVVDVIVYSTVDVIVYSTAATLVAVLKPSIADARGVLPYLKQMIPPLVALVVTYSFFIIVFATWYLADYWWQTSTAWQHIPAVDLAHAGQRVGDFLYFSLMTIFPLGLGYSEILPLSATARGLVSCEALVGSMLSLVAISAIVAYLAPRFADVARQQARRSRGAPRLVN